MISIEEAKKDEVEQFIIGEYLSRLDPEEEVGPSCVWWHCLFVLLFVYKQTLFACLHVPFCLFVDKQTRRQTKRAWWTIAQADSSDPTWTRGFNKFLVCGQSLSSAYLDLDISVVELDWSWKD